MVMREPELNPTKKLPNEKQRALLHRYADALVTNDIDDINERFEAQQALLGEKITLGNAETYTIQGCIGTGSSGSVFEVIDADGNSLAMKVSHRFNRDATHVPKEVASIADYRDAGIARKMITEVQAIFQLTKEHGDATPGPRYIDAEMIPDPNAPNERVAILVMELIEGKNLSQVGGLKRDGAKQTIDTIAGIISNIQLLQDSDIVHGDLGPQNIFLQDTAAGPRVRFIDFGGSFHFTTYLQHADIRSGVYDDPKINYSDKRPNYGLKIDNTHTEGFVPDAEPIGFERDIYSAGRIIEYLVLGMRFQRLSKNEKMIAAGDAIAEGLIQLAQDMTHPKPEDRASIQEILNRLTKLQAIL